MKLLKTGERAVVSGAKLIAGKENCGSVEITSWLGDYMSEAESQSHWGFVMNEATIICTAGEFTLGRGMYFSTAGPLSVLGGSGVLISRPEYRCLNTFGGPVENAGRLKYIDGCTDTLLLGPARIGDPCLNLLHFPNNIRQTMHTHPSLRCGIVISGRGRAITPSGELPLEPGSCWLLDTEGQHCFYTDDSEMLICAWHPDTDTGPTDENHPMLNRTYVGGVSAASIDSIRTR